MACCGMTFTFRVQHHATAFHTVGNAKFFHTICSHLIHDIMNRSSVRIIIIIISLVLSLKALPQCHYHSVNIGATITVPLSVPLSQLHYHSATIIAIITVPLSVPLSQCHDHTATISAIITVPLQCHYQSHFNSAIISATTSVISQCHYQ